MLLIEASDSQGGNNRTRRVPIALPVAAQIPAAGRSDAERPKDHGNSPSIGAKITKFYVAEATPGSGYETGPLHIIYSDGTHVIQKLPPLKKSTEKVIVVNAVGFSQIQLADDEQTLGWAVQIGNLGSYSIPFSVDLFRSGRVIHSLNSGIMVWNWLFVQGGKQVAVVYGPIHGEPGDYRLYDVKTGQLVSKWHPLKPDAPDWVKRLEQPH